MRKISSSIPAIAAAMVLTLPAWADDLAAVKQALEAKFALTMPTADKTDIVTPGSVLVLKKSNLITVDVKSKNLYQNKYVNGRITQNAMGKTSSWLKKLPGASAAGGSERIFVSGEKVWLTGMEVKDTAIVFTLFTDAYSDTRYEATLTFPFEKGSTPSVSDAMAMVGQVFDVQAADDGKGQQQAQAAAGGQAAAPSGVKGAAPQQAEAPPPPIAPPPPPPADPKTIALGQTQDQVTANFGQPDKIIKLGTKQIYVYKDMKVTFVGGKVTDVQ